MEIPHDLGIRGAARARSNESVNSRAQNYNSGSAGGSTLQVSDSAQQLNELVRLVQGSSEVRTDKVDALKQKIETGQYQVDLDKLAERLSEEL